MLIGRQGTQAPGGAVSLALDDSGVLHLTFADVTRKGGMGVKGAVKYARGMPTAS